MTTIYVVTTGGTIEKVYSERSGSEGGSQIVSGQENYPPNL